MRDLLDPKNDYVFKRLFADAPLLLAALIDAIRPRAAPIARLTVKNPTIDAEELRGKYIVLDLLAEDTDGAQYDIEMQVRRYRAWSARSAYYLAKLVSGQLVCGEDYGGLKPAIGIHLLDFDLFQDPAHREQAIWCFEMRDAQTPTVTALIVVPATGGRGFSRSGRADATDFHWINRKPPPAEASTSGC